MFPLRSRSPLSHSQQRRSHKSLIKFGWRLVFFISLVAFCTPRLLWLQTKAAKQHSLQQRQSLGYYTSTKTKVVPVAPSVVILRGARAGLPKELQNEEQQRQTPQADNNATREYSSTELSLNTSSFQSDPYYVNMKRDEMIREIATRSERFPSVMERVQLYMSDWYTPPCQGNLDAFIKYDYTDDGDRLIVQEISVAKEDKPRVFELETDDSSKMIFFPDRERISKCPHEYCNDTIKYIFPAIDRTVGHQDVVNTPLILQFGDTEWSTARIHGTPLKGKGPNVPIIKKFRLAMTRQELDQLTQTKKCYRGPRDYPTHLSSIHQRFQPIIWKLKTIRHFGYVSSIPKQDIPWSKKRNAAVFRGGLTGIHSNGLKSTDFDRRNAKQVCFMVDRCRMVVQHNQSMLVDARLTRSERDSVRNNNNDFTLPDVVDGVHIYAQNRLSREQLLQYKAIIMIEGNDVSSGLKWALYSNSVVLMPPPTKTSWAMEELLEPWVHYVPLNENLTDIEDKVLWVLDHEKDAQRIAHRGKQWIRDLLFHPDAESDEEAIFDEMMKRYRAHFIKQRGLVDKKDRPTDDDDDDDLVALIQA